MCHLSDLSGLVIGRPRPDADRGADLLSDLVPITPTTQRTFQRSEPISAYLRLYQGGKDALAAVQIRARIVDAADAAVVDEASTVDADDFKPTRSAEYRLELPLERFSTGQYLLTIEATLGKTRVSRDLRFSVR